MSILLEIEHLNVRYPLPVGVVAPVRDVRLSLAAGECLGIVGESGCGKTQLCLAVLGLLPASARVSGSVRFEGLELLGCDESRLRGVRGGRIAMVFQDPMTALTPHMRIGEQLAEVSMTHAGLGRRASLHKAAEMLELVHIPDAGRHLRQYPHQLSGGMRQRVTIAMALLGEPALLLADEPTTALDVTVQAQILELLKELRSRLAMAIVIVTHDLGVIAGLADRVVVMYAGRVIEQAPVETLFRGPLHPYSKALLASVPTLRTPRTGAIRGIEGQPPTLRDDPPGCAFHPRCAAALDRCVSVLPTLQTVADGHLAACHLHDRSKAIQ